MKSDPEPGEIFPVSAGEASNYATREEVQKAIHDLTDTEHAKLMLIARGFCKGRRLSSSVMEPEELLSEAFVKTLAMDKKWNKRVSMVKHLDRAMENISGHLVRERKKIIAFPDGLAPDRSQRQESTFENAADDELISREETQALLTEVFGDDLEAVKIFALRAEGFQAGEIQTNLRLTMQQYNTIARRIRRKISTFLIQKK